MVAARGPRRSPVLRLHVRYRVDRRAGTVAVSAAVMFPYDPQHQTFVNIYEGETLTSQAILDGSHPHSSTSPARVRASWRSIEKFVPAGIHHILIGPDHLLFLVGLLLLGGTRPPARCSSSRRSPSRTASRCRSRRSTS